MKTLTPQPKTLTEQYNRMRSLVGLEPLVEQEAPAPAPTTAPAAEAPTEAPAEGTPASKVMPESICAFVPSLATQTGNEITATIVTPAEFASYATKPPTDKALGLIRIDVSPFFVDKISAVKIPTSGQVKVRIGAEDNGVFPVTAAAVSQLGQLTANKVENGKPIMVAGYYITIKRLLESPFSESSFLKDNMNTQPQVREMLDPNVYSDNTLFKTYNT